LALDRELASVAEKDLNGRVKSDGRHIERDPKPKHEDG